MFQGSSSRRPKARLGKGVGLAVLFAGLAGAAYAIFAGFGPAPTTVPAGADAGNPEQVALGRKVYMRSCASCHGARLEGQPDWRRRKPDGHLPAPPHDETGHTWHHPDRQLFEMTAKGPKAFAGAGYASDMPGFEGTLTDAEIWAVIAYIKSRWPKDVRERQEEINRRFEAGTER